MKRQQVGKVPVTPPQPVAQAIAALAAAGNSGMVINWERLHENENAVGSLVRRKHFDLLVKLANRGAVKAAEWNALVGGRVLIDNRLQPVEFELPEQYRAWLAEHLGRIVNGRSRESANAVVKAASVGVVEIPAWKITAGRLEKGYRIVARDIRAALAYGVLLLLDPEGDHARELRRCRLSSCGHFYWYSGDGTQSTRKYCSREHRKAGYNEQTAARVARHRKRIRS